VLVVIKSLKTSLSQILSSVSFTLLSRFIFYKNVLVNSSSDMFFS
jgi:hypothetical protein